jgi:conjugative relaxase-like TrwC/TraI family protein
MLSVAKAGRARWHYYQDNVAHNTCDYYSGEGETPGRWAGRGLEPLDLMPGATVEEAELEAAFGRAINPSTDQALGRAWRVDGVTGYDLCFSAPKSVSTLWALGGPEVGSAVQAAHQAAVGAALSYLEDHAAFSRKGYNGVEQIATAGLASALFDHRTSRTGDPQLHTHALTLNKALCVDGRWRTLDGHEIYHHQKAAGSIYQAALRGELSERLGITFNPPNAHGQAEIAGVPVELTALWSSRTAQVVAEADPLIAEYEAALGRPLTSRERTAIRKVAVIKTRPPKERIGTTQLHERWRAEAGALGWTGRRLLESVRRSASGRTQGVQASPAVTTQAVTAAGTRRAVFSRADLTVEVAARQPATPRSADEIRRDIETLTDAALAQPHAVQLGTVRDGLTPRRSDDRYATAELVAAEARVLALANAGQRAGHGVVIPLHSVQRIRESNLAPDQRVAVMRLTCNGDFISLMTAPAGTGKTTTLGVAVRAWRDSGFDVVALAPSARAAAELARATGGRAETVAKWLYELNRLPHMPAQHQTVWSLTQRTVLIVDEASMANTFDLDRLANAAWTAGAKVVLVGDPAQIGVVEGPGGLLGALAARLDTIELGDVHRFEQAWERDASLQLRRGDPCAVRDYAENNRLHTSPDSETGLSDVYEHWARARADGSDALMLARSRKDVTQLNLRARSRLIASGELIGRDVTIGGRHWQPGDVLRARRNDRTVRIGDRFLRNGDRFRVVVAHSSGLVVDSLDEPTRGFLPTRYVERHADYGWASTIDGAQGATADIGILLARPGIDREHLYVGMTRGRRSNHVYVVADIAEDHHHLGPSAPADAAQELTNALRRQGSQLAAHDAMACATAAADVRTGDPTRRGTQRTWPYHDHYVRLGIRDPATDRALGR